MMLMLLLLLLLCMYLVPGSVSYRVSGCGQVRLVCEEGSKVVVSEASFTPVYDEKECQEEVMMVNNGDILSAVVGRCNGERECVVDMAVELPESAGWGRGRTGVRYSCQENIHSYCGGRVTVGGEGGYISSPGYPRYYLGGRECVWTMVGEEGQKIKLEVADLSLRGTGEECSDSVVVREEDKTLVTLCGGQRLPVSLVSSLHQVEVRMVVSASMQAVYPRRGLLLHYTVQGCPSPPHISEGRIVVVNTSQAVIQCNTGHVLQYSLAPVQYLYCRYCCQVQPNP